MPELAAPATNPLRRHTAARVLLTRAGDTVSTTDQLLFALDHAMARDAVNTAIDPVTLSAQLTSLGLRPMSLASAAPDRAAYLRRPDLGRTLATPLEAQQRSDAVFLIADGLSALAVARHAIPLLTEILSQIDRDRWTLGPVPILTQARVALGDHVGAALRTDMTVMLIGERPGLSAPDSLGVYLTWNPAPERTDAERNCISNIRAGGLSYSEAAARVIALMEQARTRAYTGVYLKETLTPELLGTKAIKA